MSRERWVLKKKQVGLCVSCGKNRASVDTIKCERCRQKAIMRSRAWTRMLTKKRRAERGER